MVIEPILSTAIGPLKQTFPCSLIYRPFERSSTVRCFYFYWCKTGVHLPTQWESEDAAADASRKSMFYRWYISNGEENRTLVIALQKPLKNNVACARGT